MSQIEPSQSRQLLQNHRLFKFLFVISDSRRFLSSFRLKDQEESGREGFSQTGDEGWYKRSYTGSYEWDQLCCDNLWCQLPWARLSYLFDKTLRLRKSIGPLQSRWFHTFSESCAPTYILFLYISTKDRSLRHRSSQQKSWDVLCRNQDLFPSFSKYSW